MQDLLSGQIQMAFLNPATAAPHVRTGAIKALGVTSAKRMKILPEVPTMEQAGFQGGMEFSLWTAIFGPKGMPKAIVDTVNNAVMSSLASAKVQKRLETGGVDIAAPEKQSPASLAAIQQADIKKWWPIIDAAGIKPQ